jgi:hypothetical protein
MMTALTCPECGRSGRYDNPRPGTVISCPGCRACYEVDARGQPRALPAAEAVEPPAANAVLSMLDALEGLFIRMLVGIFHFLARSLPLWLGRQLVSLARIATKAARVLLVFSAWAGLCFLPLLLLHRLPGGLPTLLAAAWTALALAGSVWGAFHARRWRPRLWRRRAARVPQAIPVTAAEVAG